MEPRESSAYKRPALVVVSGLHVEFPVRSSFLDRRKRVIHAVNDLSLTIHQGEIVGLVGESGSGKSTLGRAMLGLVRATHGRITIKGQDVSDLSERNWRPLRRQAQIIFQESHASLSPRMRVRKLLTEGYAVHHIPPNERRSAQELLDLVGLGSEQADKFPHELSGGQARRVGIARVLALNPAFIVADEITSGLDVGAAAEIIRLVATLSAQHEIAFLVISHDLNMVSQIADRVAVVYLGQIVEIGAAENVLSSPVHPYTKALLASVAVPDPNVRPPPPLVGEIPSPAERPTGCTFHTRCPHATDLCRKSDPAFEPVLAAWSVRCHFWKELASDTYPAATEPDDAAGEQ